GPPGVRTRANHLTGAGTTPGHLPHRSGHADLAPTFRTDAVGEVLERGLGHRSGDPVDVAGVAPTAELQQALQRRHRAASDDSVDVAGVAPVRLEVALERHP